MDELEGARIGSAEAARRLGVKIETLYAYVSRGYLSSRRRPGRPSTFDRDEVEALRAAGTRQRAHSSAAFRFPTVTTRLTDRGPGWLRFRGLDAVELSRTRTFDDVAGLLWTGRLGSVRAQRRPAVVAAVADLLAALPPGIDSAARLRLAVTAAAAVDPRRHDLRTDAVVRAGATAVACLLDAATPPGRRGRRGDRADPAADQLWDALAGPGADPVLRGPLTAAMVLLADHGLAASTVAARAAASARAHPYAVVGAGLATLEGPAHGANDSAAHRLLRDVFDVLDVLDAPSADLSLGDVLAQHRDAHGQTPGFVDPDSSDVRAEALVAALLDCGSAGTALRAMDAVRAVTDPDQTQRPTVELALAVLAVAAGMPIGATATITAVARTAGWVAHAIEEYQEPVLRWRANEIYTGPAPGAAREP